MTEVTKPFKIMLIVDMIIATLYAIPYMFFIGTWEGIIGLERGSTPFYSQIWGTVLFLMAAWLLRAILQKKSFEEFSYYLEFVLAILFGVIIYLALELLFVKPVGTALIYSWVSLGIVIALFVSNIVFYFIETSKHK